MKKGYIVFVACVMLFACNHAGQPKKELNNVLQEKCVLRDFSPMQIEDIYIPTKHTTYEYYKDGRVKAIINEAFLSHAGKERLYFDQFLNSCIGIHLKGSGAYKNLPEKCQILFREGCGSGYSEYYSFICSNKGCLVAKFDYLIDVETGEEMPVPDADFANAIQ